MQRQEAMPEGLDVTTLNFTVSSECPDKSTQEEEGRCDTGTCAGVAVVGNTAYIGDVIGRRLRDDYPYRPVIKVSEGDLSAFVAGIRREEFVR